MSTIKSAGGHGVSEVLFGKARRAVLALLYGHADEAFYLRQIVRMVNLGQGAVQRELARLTGAGLVVRRRQGNQVYFQANRDCPIFPELKTLVVKTSGAIEVLRAALEKLGMKIIVAFLYGSMASGKETAGSDIDLMVVGDVSVGDVAKNIQQAQKTLGREINPAVYSAFEFRKKIGAGHHFLKTVLKGPKLFVIGGERELEGLAQKRLAR